MGGKYGACAIGEGHYSLQDLVLFLEPAFCSKYNHAFLLSVLCSRDVTTYITGGTQLSILLHWHTSPMFQINHPVKGVEEVIDYCGTNKLQLIGCDADAHHIIWGSMDLNP
jgi:hypothetical protein